MWPYYFKNKVINGLLIINYDYSVFTSSICSKPYDSASDDDNNADECELINLHVYLSNTCI